MYKVFQETLNWRLTCVFLSEQLNLQLERCFERHALGHFVPYVRQTPTQTPAQRRQRPVHAKLRLYMVKMVFDVEQQVQLRQSEKLVNSKAVIST